MSNDSDYKYISLEYLEDISSGESDFLIEIIDIYLVSIPESVAKLKEAVETKSAPELAYYAHKLKGSFNFIGCTQLAHFLTEMEAYGEAGDENATIPGLLEQVITQSLGVAEELRHLHEARLTDR